MNVVSEARRNQARKHATRVHRCTCGKVCRGNGGWSSHKRACKVYAEALASLRTCSVCGDIHDRTA